MSYHYLQEAEAASWEDTCLDGAPGALLRLMPTAERSCSRGSETGISQDSQSGTTSTHSTEHPGEAQLTLLQEASPAKTSARRVKVQDLPESVQDFGSRCSELLAKFNLALSSRKTVRTCVPVDSAPSSKDLPAWGMMQDGACWELGTSVLPIDAIGCGYLPTPTTVGNEMSPSMGKWAGHRNLFTYLEKWGLLDTLAGGPSPVLREWMMGLPIGWTALEPLEMHRFRSWLQEHFKSLAKG
jgi:hypothetical protein